MISVFTVVLIMVAGALSVAFMVLVWETLGDCW